MKIIELQEKGILSIRRRIWALPDDHVKINPKGPWGTFDSPKIRKAAERNEDWAVDLWAAVERANPLLIALDTNDDWEPYDPGSVAHAISTTPTPNTKFDDIPKRD